MNGKSGTIKRLMLTKLLKGISQSLGQYIKVTEQVQLFTQNIQKIISYYTPYEIITWDNRNPVYTAYFWDKSSTDLLTNFDLFKHISKLPMRNPSKGVIHAYQIKY